MLKKPKYNYGRGLNPCTDCKMYMFSKAKEMIEEDKKTSKTEEERKYQDFIVTGEVAGQRLKKK
jgi:tRNA-uridine 2-sulfurtransferase